MDCQTQWPLSREINMELCFSMACKINKEKKICFFSGKKASSCGERKPQDVLQFCFNTSHYLERYLCKLQLFLCYSIIFCLRQKTLSWRENTEHLGLHVPQSELSLAHCGQRINIYRMSHHL